MGTRYLWYSNTVPCTNDCWNWLLFVKSQREVFKLRVGCSNTRWTSSGFSFVLQVVNENKVLPSQNFMEKFEPSILTNKSTIKNLQILLVFMFFFSISVKTKPQHTTETRTTCCKSAKFITETVVVVIG